MSRFNDISCEDMNEEEQEKFEREVADAFVQAKEDLGGFLAYLEAMPDKRIISDRFVEPKTMLACAVGEYCRYRGADKKSLLKIEGQSFLERYENDGAEECDGWEGRTVYAGMKAGLPHLVAFRMAYANDEQWNTVATDEKETVTTSWGTYQRTVYRKMTPEERWKKLRDYVAAHVTAAA